MRLVLETLLNVGARQNRSRQRQGANASLYASVRTCGAPTTCNPNSLTSAIRFLPMQGRTLAGAALIGMLWSSSSLADTPPAMSDDAARAPSVALSVPPAVTQEPATETHWYGWQTLLVDGAALGVTIGGFWLRPAHQDWSVVTLAGIGAWAVGAPIVHWSHGRAGVGFASLGFRIALPALGLLLMSTPCSSSECSEGILAASLGLAIIPAPIVLDAAWLARERQASGVTQSAHGGLQLAPLVTAFGGRRMLGVSGRF